MTSDGKYIVEVESNGSIGIIDLFTGSILTIRVLPLLLVGLDFSIAKIPDEETKELFRQNEAKV